MYRFFYFFERGYLDMIVQNISQNSHTLIARQANPNNVISKQNSLDTSLTLQISQEGQKLGELFKKFYEEYHSAEAIEKRQREQMEKEQAYHRLADEFSLHVVYHFPENTLQHAIQKALEGKVVNASLYAAELASAIRSSVSMPDKSAEERAAYREMALKQAEYIAENYFDNEEEAIRFLNEIKKYYENDILREKGYVVIDNSDIKPFKKYSSPVSNNEVSFFALAKKYMDEDYLDRFINGKGTPEESRKFLNQLQQLKKKYTKEMIKEYEQIEQQAVNHIHSAKSMLEKLTWKNGRVTNQFEKQPRYLNDLVEWNNRLLNMFV